MKTTIKTIEKFNAVKTFRIIKEQIAKETEKMTYEQFKEYLKNNQLLTAK